MKAAESRKDALPSLRAATDPDAAPGGGYYAPGGCAGLWGPAVPGARYPREALDPVLCGRLWRLSEELTGCTFDVAE